MRPIMSCIPRTGVRSCRNDLLPTFMVAVEVTFKGSSGPEAAGRTDWYDVRRSLVTEDVVIKLSLRLLDSSVERS